MSKVDVRTLGETMSFLEFLMQQEEWVRQLLEDHELIGVGEVGDILKEHHAAGGLLIVSDGLVRQHKMAYGWVVANNATQTILAQDSGPGFGRGSSLRAEAYVMLAAVVFVKLICAFTSRETEVNLTNVADNAELIN